MAHILLDESAAPSTPATGKVSLYVKTDGLPYSKDDAGTETALGGAPVNADFLVKTANASLSAERVVTDNTDVTFDWSVAGQVKALVGAFTGDITKLAGSLATTIANLAVTTAKIAGGAVTFAKMQDIATDRLLGRDTAGSGSPEELTVGGGIEFTGTGIQTSAFTGDVTKAAGGTATTIAADAVTYAKMQNVSAASRLLGRGSASGAGDTEEITLGTGLSMAATTLNASAVARYQTAQTGNYTVDFANGPHQTVICNTNAFTVTLPTAVGADGKTARIVKAGSDTNAITLATTSSQTVGKHATAVLKLYVEDDFIEVESDGANWQIVAENVTIYARAYRATSNQVITTATDTKIQFNAENEDTAAAYDSATNFRFTAPRSGLYSLSWRISISPSSAGLVKSSLFKNGSDLARGFQVATTGDDEGWVAATTIRLVKDDYVEIYGQHTRGSNSDLVLGSAVSWLTVSYVGN